MNSPAQLDAATLRERLTAPDAPRVIDVRTPGEFSAVHIPGSYNVPLDLLREHRDELRRCLDSDVVLVCRSGQRAGQAERALTEAGIDGVHVLADGMTGWQRTGGPVNRGPARWDLERQVRLVAGALVLLGVLGGVLVPGMEWFAAAIGAGLVVAALTGTCAMGALLARLPWNRDRTCDIDQVVAQLTGRR